MICEEVMELIQRHVDGDLTEEETVGMTEHVRECADCAAMLERLRRLSEGLMQLPKITPPFSLVDAILPQLDAIAIPAEAKAADDVPGSVSEPLPPRSSRPVRTYIGRLAAVVALGIAIGVLVFNEPLRLGGSASDNAAVSDTADSDAQPELRMQEKEALTAPAPAAKPHPSYDTLSGSGESPSAESGINDKAAKSKEETSDRFAADSSAQAGGSEKQSRSDSGGKSNDSANKELAAPTSSESPETASEPPPDTGFNKSGTSDQMELTETPAAIMSMSPDRQWKSVASPEGVIKVLKEAGDELFFESPVRHGMPTDVRWNEESTQLFYTFTDEAGNKANYMFDVTTRIETLL